MPMNGPLLKMGVLSLPLNTGLQLPLSGWEQLLSGLKMFLQTLKQNGNKVDGKETIKKKKEL